MDDFKNEGWHVLSLLFRPTYFYSNLMPSKCLSCILYVYNIYYLSMTIFFLDKKSKS